MKSVLKMRTNGAIFLKSQCKVLENDYYRNEDGTLVTDRKFILAPWWLAVEIGA